MKTLTYTRCCSSNKLDKLLHWLCGDKKRHKHVVSNTRKLITIISSNIKPTFMGNSGKMGQTWRHQFCVRSAIVPPIHQVEEPGVKSLQVDSNARFREGGLAYKAAAQWMSRRADTHRSQSVVTQSHAPTISWCSSGVGGAGEGYTGCTAGTLGSRLRTMSLDASTLCIFADIKRHLQLGLLETFLGVLDAFKVHLRPGLDPNPTGVLTTLLQT